MDFTMTRFDFSSTINIDTAQSITNLRLSDESLLHTSTSTKTQTEEVKELSSLMSININKPQVTFVNTLPNIFEHTDAIVMDFLESLAIQNEKLILIRNHALLMRHDHIEMTSKVKILSGGAAGLHPLSGGFIGKGMLTAAIFGEMSSSPLYMSILASLRILARHHDKGILVLVLNNLADRLNFGLACQLAAFEGIKTLCLTVGEDCSGNNSDKPIGRRGMCGIVFLQKIAGALSEEGRSLYEMHCILTALNGGSLGTIDIGIHSDGITIGEGLQGEAGKRKVHYSIPIIVNDAIYYLFHYQSKYSLHIQKGDSVAVIVNNLGKLSDLQMSLVAREFVIRLDNLGIKCARVYCARLMTSNAVLGFSFSVLKVNKRIVDWLDSDVDVLSWPVRRNEPSNTSTSFKDRCLVYIRKSSDSFSLLEYNEGLPMEDIGPRFTIKEAKMVVNVLQEVVRTLINMEEYLNELDFDGDFGTNIKKLMARVKQEMDSKLLSIVSPFGLFNDLAEMAATNVGGITGAIYSVMFRSAAQAFLVNAHYVAVNWQMWITAGQLAVKALAAYTQTCPGNRTVMDALNAFVEEFTLPTVRCLNKAVQAAMRGAENTAFMNGIHPHPDPGAYALAVALRAIFTELQVDLMEMESSDSFRSERTELSYKYDKSAVEMKQSFCDSCHLEMQLEDQGLRYCSECMRNFKLEQESRTLGSLVTLGQSQTSLYSRA